MHKISLTLEYGRPFWCLGMGIPQKDVIKSDAPDTLLPENHADYIASCDSKKDDYEYMNAFENEWHLGLDSDGSHWAASSHEQRGNTGVYQVMST